MALAEQYDDERYEGMLFADGFDAAFIGVGQRCGEESIAVYDREKAIEILAEEMSYEDAMEYFEFNVEGAWVGERTPIFVEKQCKT